MVQEIDLPPEDCHRHEQLSQSHHTAVLRPAEAPVGGANPADSPSTRKLKQLITSIEATTTRQLVKVWQKLTEAMSWSFAKLMSSAAESSNDL